MSPHNSACSWSCGTHHSNAGCPFFPFSNGPTRWSGYSTFKCAVLIKCYNSIYCPKL